jgi:hypothetical protein
METVVKLFVTFLCLIALTFIGEQAYGAFVLGNQLRYGSITASVVTLLFYIIPFVGFSGIIYILWKKKKVTS